MTLTRLFAASAALALTAGLSLPAAAQTTPATAKTEAQAKVATGKPTSDAPAKTQPQGAARAVAETAPGVNVAAQTPAATAGAATAAEAGAPVKVQGDLMDTLKLSGQFTTLVKAIDATNLSGLLKTNRNLTVFAPTDAAFAAFPQDQLQRLMADKVALQKFVLRHVINAPVDSSKIKGARGPVPSGAGDSVLLDGSDEAALRVDGARIVQADIRTGSGLLHVVDKVLVAGQGDAAPTAAAAPTGAAAPTSGQTSASADGTKSKPQ